MKQSQIIFISSIVVLTLATSVGIVFYLYSLRPDWFGVKQQGAEQAANNIQVTSALVAKKLKLSKLAVTASQNDFNTEISDFNSAPEAGTDYEKELRDRSQAKDRKAAPPNKNLVILPPSPPTLEIPPEPEISIPKLPTAEVVIESLGQETAMSGYKKFFAHQFRVRNLFNRPGFDAIVLAYSRKQDPFKELLKTANFKTSDGLSNVLTLFGKPARHYVIELGNDFVLEQSREYKETGKASALMKQYFESLIKPPTDLEAAKTNVNCLLYELIKIQDSHAAILYNYRKDRMTPITAESVVDIRPENCVKLNLKK